MKQSSTTIACAVVGLAMIAGIVGCGSDPNAVEGTPPTAAQIQNKDTRTTTQATQPGSAQGR